jgi:NosR/NirI family transcriptional regulator, nitrous oxide reductase regulator
MKLADILKVSFEFSSKLGVRESPQVSSDYQSNIPGLYVVGDLADAPIIKVALNQGYDVAQEVVSKLGVGHSAGGEAPLDVVVVGAGPAGIGAALALREAGVSYVVIEKERPFNTIQNFPKAKRIFSEPRSLLSRGNFWFEDASKEILVSRWDEALEKKELRIHQPEAVVDIDKDPGGGFVVHAKVGADGRLAVAEAAGGSVQGNSNEAHATNRYRTRYVILAIGRRGAVRRLNIPGERLEKVDYALKDPEDYRGQRLLVVGGGDSAVEAAMACAKSDSDVTISYRQNDFIRAKADNRTQIMKMIAEDKLKAEFNTIPAKIEERHVLLKRGAQEIEVENDRVLIFAGTELPSGFLKKVGIRMAGAMDIARLTWILSFALITYLFYVLKQKKAYWPFGSGDLLAAVPKALEVDLGFRTVGPSFWGTVIYALLILVFGLRAYRKYPSVTQKRRYKWLILFQWVFLFGIPEILGPAVIKLGVELPGLLARPWKFYAISVPWPLSIWSVADGPGWGGATAFTAGLWVAIGILVSFVAVPLYVRSQGLRFCSYLCGCGGLAETVGDYWRHLAPRGRTSYRAEWFGRVVLLLAIPVTLLIINDAWGFFAKGALYNAKEFARSWYGLVVDFWLASVVGVALYPYLGSRVWCRFICPLRAYMELWAKRWARLTIKANSKCIGCGECTRYCQMGIQVQSFAQARVDLDNSKSSCIQCGICVQVCPMEVLSLGDRDFGHGKGARLAPATGPRDSA